MDFIDIYFLLDKFDISEIIRFYNNKYDQDNEALILKSLIYLDEINDSDWPVLIKNPGLKITDIKKRIEKAVLQYAKKS